MLAYLSCLLASDRHRETDHLFPVRRRDVADLKAESREPPGFERLRGERYVDRVDRLLTGVDPFDAVGGELEGPVGSRVIELYGTPLVVEVLDLRDHQADAVRHRATPEPECSHQPRRGDDASGDPLHPLHNSHVRDLAGDDAGGVHLYCRRRDGVALLLERHRRERRTLEATGRVCHYQWRRDPPTPLLV